MKLQEIKGNGTQYCYLNPIGFVKKHPIITALAVLAIGSAVSYYIMNQSPTLDSQSGNMEQDYSELKKEFQKQFGEDYLDIVLKEDSLKVETEEYIGQANLVNSLVPEVTTSQKLYYLFKSKRSHENSCSVIFGNPSTKDFYFNYSFSSSSNIGEACASPIAKFKGYLMRYQS